MLLAIAILAADTGTMATRDAEWNENNRQRQGQTTPSRYQRKLLVSAAGGCISTSAAEEDEDEETG